MMYNMFSYDFMYDMTGFKGAGPVGAGPTQAAPTNFRPTAIWGLRNGVAVHVGLVTLG